jgi:hypothetical protein
MLFTEAPHYRAGLAGEYYPYLNFTEERVMYVAGKFGIDARVPDLNTTCRIGVPYLIPVRDLMRIAKRWSDVLDEFRTIDWIDIMYAFGLAITIEELVAGTTHIMNHNGRPMSPVNRPIVHYCYGDPRWNKRHFVERSPFVVDCESPSPDIRGSIHAEILTQIAEARDVFRDASAAVRLT